MIGISSAYAFIKSQNQIIPLEVGTKNDKEWCIEFPQRLFPLQRHDKKSQGM